MNDVFIALLALACACGVTALIVWLSEHHHHLTADHDVAGVQKFHTHPVPRVGGVGVMAGLLVAAALTFGWGEGNGLLWGVLLAGIPAFVAGLAEDVTKRVGVMARLLATMASGAVGVVLLDAVLPRLGVPGLDTLLQALPWLAWAVTLVAVAGVANAVNIIDGFNGLAAGATGLMFAAFGTAAWWLGDSALAMVCAAMLGAVLGFAAWNWPGGRIFLGDGGAYLVGFVLAEVAVLLVARHPQVSPWFALLVCAYPVTETLFSIYRRWRRRAHPGQPDAQHLHSLIYRRLVRNAGRPQRSVARNSAVAPYLWVLTASAAVPALVGLWLRAPGWVFALGYAAFVGLYVQVYRRIVRFRVPPGCRRRVRSIEPAALVPGNRIFDR